MRHAVWAILVCTTATTMHAQAAKFSTKDVTSFASVYRALTVERDKYETTAAFEARREKTLGKTYTVPMAFGAEDWWRSPTIDYDADAQTATVTFSVDLNLSSSALGMEIAERHNFGAPYPAINDFGAKFSARDDNIAVETIARDKTDNDLPIPIHFPVEASKARAMIPAVRGYVRFTPAPGTGGSSVIEGVGARIAATPTRPFRMTSMSHLIFASHATVVLVDSRDGAVLIERSLWTPDGRSP